MGSLTTKKKVFVIASLLIAGLATMLVIWMLREPDLQPGGVVTQCNGFITNSTGVNGCYVVSNRNTYAIKIFYYFEGRSRDSVFNGQPCPTIVLAAGSHTNITTQMHTHLPADIQFWLLYQNYSAKTRLYDYAKKHRLTGLLPAKWRLPVLDDHCPLCQ
jgi:hypothetical protein